MWVDGDAEAGEHGANAAGLLATGDGAQHGAWIWAHENILSNVEMSEEFRVLIDRGDAGFACLHRSREADGCTFEQHLTLVGLYNAGDDLDECRFAGTVLADEGMDASASNRKRDVG